VAYAAQLHAPAACGLGEALERDFTALQVTDDGTMLVATGMCDVMCVVDVREATNVPAQSDPSGPWPPALQSAEARCCGHDDDLGFWRDAEPSYSVSALRTTATDGAGVGGGRGGSGGGREDKENAQRRSGGRARTRNGGRATMTGMCGAAVGAAEALLDSAGEVMCVAAGARGGWEVRWVPARAVTVTVTDEDATGVVREERGAGVLALGAAGESYVLTPDALSLLLSTTRLRALGNASDDGSTDRSMNPQHEWCRGSRDQRVTVRSSAAVIHAERDDWLPGAETWVPALLDHVLAFQGLQAAQRLCALNGWRGGATLCVRRLALAMAAGGGGGGGTGAVHTGALIAS
jgi:hypothetical protein